LIIASYRLQKTSIKKDFQLSFLRQENGNKKSSQYQKVTATRANETQ